MKPALIESPSLAALLAASIAITSAQSLREPLPLDVVTSLRSHNGRSPVNLSPDGEWLAHTYGRDETVPPHRDVREELTAVVPCGAQGRNNDSQEWGFYEIDVETGTARAVWQETRIYFTSFNVDMNEKGGDIVFAACDQRHPGERLLGADAISVGLQRLGKKVEYRIYEDEGHVINRKANVIDFWNRRLEFLQEFLGPTR